MILATYVVKNGDTLWSIAEAKLGSGTKWTILADANNIPRNNPTIYPGQVIRLDFSSATPSVSKPKPRITVDYFGLQSGTDNTLFASWTWNKSQTDHYATQWYYDTGDGIWFVGNESDVKVNQCTYNIPNNAKAIRFKVKPVSTSKTVNGSRYSEWTADWSTEKYFYPSSDAPPKACGTPNVEVDGFKLTATLDNLDINELNATHVQFQIVKDNMSTFNSSSNIMIIKGHVSYSCTLTAGHTYTVRCRTWKNNKYSDWSDYSSEVGTIPLRPNAITTLKAISNTEIYIEWALVNNAKTYEIQYTNKIEYFDASGQTTSVTGIESNYYRLTGLESGKQYLFRVRAVNDAGNSDWSEIRAITIGKAPSAPTTWSSTTTCVTGEDLYLYWIHNSEDGSSQTRALVELDINGAIEAHIINSEDEKDDEKTTYYAIDTSKYSEGTKIQWRVQTAGATKVYGDWSVQRTVDIYSPATLEIHLTDINSQEFDVLTSFPFYVYGIAGPSTQIPVSYNLTVISNESYETVDNIGNVKMVNSGEEIYSKNFDISESLLVELSAGNIDLENNVSYTVKCTVTMNSGLTAEASANFSVFWTDEMYEPNAEINIDKETVSASIRPYCRYYPIVYYKVTNSSGLYVKTSETIDEIQGTYVTKEVPDETDGGIKIEFLTTTTGEEVLSGTTASGGGIYFCIVTDTNGSLSEEVELSVYRREYDGTFTEIATGIDNSKNTYVTDPHPSLDYARYRIVAKSKVTGAVSYYDVPGVIVGEKAVIIQWNEEWSDFDTTNEDALTEPPWSGSMLKLPYNIDVSDSYNKDYSLIEYIGRNHPVSYYGTQLGEKASWSVEIPKEDKDTIYALRRLSRWMGDVYVREPSGTGYWANLQVSFSQTHCEVTVPVSLDITRVEGGV